MLAQLLLSAVIALLALIAWQLWRCGSTQTQVAGGRVTLQALEAVIAETDAHRSREIAALRARVEQLDAELAENARTMNIVTRAIEVHFTADQQRNEQLRGDVCATGGHALPRIR